MRILFVLPVILLSCSQGSKDPLGLKLAPEKCIRQLFFEEGNNDFGRYRVGMTRAAFDDAGNTSVIYHTVEEVTDSIPLCRNDGIYAEASFRFFDSFLADIDVHFFLQDKEQLSAVFNAILDELTRKYGEPRVERGYYSWIEERGSRVVQIYLNDDAVAFGKPVIHLLFFSEGKFSV